MRRGTTLKRRTDKELVIERKMVTHHDVMVWDLETCVGCQLGPKICPMDSLTHTEGTIVDGRMATKLLVDVDPDTCVFCGMCVAMCPVHAISMTLNGESCRPGDSAGQQPNNSIIYIFVHVFYFRCPTWLYGD